MSERWRHVHLDPLGGIAGDMVIAALLDAMPEQAGATFAAMRAAGLPPGWRVGLEAHHDGVLAGRRLVVEAERGAERAPDGRFRVLARKLSEASLRPPVRERALAILTLLAEAEAAVHGVSLDEVHFHELADWDSLADVVGAAHLIEALGAASWSVAPLPLGSGRVRTEHGPLPVPAPATVRLLGDLPVTDDGIPGERVTPTGAAILRHLRPERRLPAGAWRLAGSGIGFGTKRLAGISNVLRLLVYAADTAGRQDEQVAVVTFEVDDQSPEDLALGLDRLRVTPGVLDVVQMPAIGKKGRLTVHVQVLARPAQLSDVIEQCLLETTTIGLRWRIEARAVLARELRRVGDDAVKVVARPDGTRTAKAEALPAREEGGHAARVRRRRRAEAAALKAEHDDGAG